MTTIRQSERIFFNGQSSEDFGIINCNVSSGLMEEPIWGSKSINETKVRGRDVAFFHGVESQSLSFELTLAFENEWTSDQIREVMRWLRTDYYAELVFSSKPDQLVYAMVIDIKLMHNSNNGGYIAANFRCNSPYFYGNVESAYYDLTTNPSGTNIEIYNNGDLEIKPVLTIKKKNDGDIAITNLSNNGDIVSITGLKDTQKLIIDGENEDLYSSATGTLTLTGSVNDAQTVTIGSRIYEFDTNSSVISGNVKVDVSGGATPSAAVTALVTAITNDVSKVVDAIDGNGDTVVVTSVSGDIDGSTISTTETLTNGSWAKTTLDNVYPHSSWNGEVVTLVYGKNVLNIYGTCELLIRWQYKFLAGE